MKQGPRIYNLFPLLAGPIKDWVRHLDRIAALGCDWVYVNPFHYPGFSGSLYAIKDYYRLHPLLAEEGEDQDALLRHFTEAAAERGLQVMMDLVINHTGKDALLTEAHPGWYRRDAQGELYSPRAVDPDDPDKVTIWGDLAALDYDDPAQRPAQIAYWADYLRHYLQLGFTGFRCDAAYQVPAEVWRELIAAAREHTAGAVFAAETLGCTTEQVTALAPCGFDYFFNSVKWWDGRADWLLDQYELYRPIAPTIGFPENHDTPRLRAELPFDDPALLAQAYRQRYLIAAAFATGVMVPMGFEFGFGKRVHVVESRPEDWAAEADSPLFDIRDFIARTHAVKAAIATLNVEGPQRRISPPQAPVTILMRWPAPPAHEAREVTALLINTDAREARAVDPGQLLTAAGGRIEHFEDVTPGVQERLSVLPGERLTLLPGEVRLFVGRGAADDHRLAAEPQQSEARLQRLAADRVLIENVAPAVNGGRFPVKRVVGDTLELSADILCDGHDKLAAEVRFGPPDMPAREVVPMRLVDNDRWQATLPLTHLGRMQLQIHAWRDLFASWRDEVSKKRDAGRDIALELIEGRRLVEAALAEGRGQASALRELLAGLEGAGEGAAVGLLLGERTAALMRQAGPRANVSTHGHPFEVIVDRPAARFAAWYEIFPRSASGDVGRHGTFDDVIRRLPAIRDMGFDVLYFPPIHPIGRTNRKGRNNSLSAGPDDPGSPYAIGAAEGGHDALHPELGDFAAFERLIAAVHAHDMELALDFAIQCSPDHPWLKSHPEWFDWRPDGSIKFAENPPKKYEDIVNVHFYGEALPALWYALRDVVLFWAARGVRIFRVDNPHTKPLPFWEWMIREVQDRYPDAIFLAEAFTRPKMMNALAKLGFTMSYTYFTWRDSKPELQAYLEELVEGPPREFFRPNFFVNTPDINPVFLQSGKRPAFLIRAVLAATLAGVYGVYNGFELCEHVPVPGKEEYLDSEKYELKDWDWDRPGNIRAEIRQLNRIRRQNPALHDHLNLRFHNAWDDAILVFSKLTRLRDNAVLVAVNLDPDHARGAHFEVPLWEFGLPDSASIDVEDLLSGEHFRWDGKVQHVWLDPDRNPYAIWRLTA